jgi:nitrogen fixation NifU-like protein
MINNHIIKIASNTSNVGLTNNYSYKSSIKNSLCGDLIKVELTAKNSKIDTMKYETESCVYCEASASLLAKKLKKMTIKSIKKDLNKIKNLSFKEMNFDLPKKFIEFKFLINKDNINRLNCVLLPLNAVLKALKR